MEEKATAEVQGTNLYEQIMALANDEEPVKDGQSESEAEAQQETAEVEEQPVEEPQATEPPTFKVKVGNEELEVTQDELLAGYQRQADYTRKTQELAAQRRELEETAARLRSQVVGRQTPEQLAGSDPYATIERVNQELEVLDGQLREALSKDDIFTIPKIQYRQQQLQRLADGAVNRIQEASHMIASMKSSIPDFDAKAPALTRFLSDALPDDPLTEQEISHLTNPLVMGRLAIKLTKLVNQFYDANTKSKQVAEQKIVKPVPQQTVKPGNASMAPKATNAEILKKKAMSDGSEESWMNWIGAHTKAQRKG